MKRNMDFCELAVFVECSTGSTPTVQTLKKYIDILEQFGYTHLYLGLTDAYKIEGEPYFNFCRGGYTIQQLQEIDDYAQTKGIELRANVQVLGHLAYMSKYDCYKDLFDMPEVLMVGKEEVYEFIDKILATMSTAIKSRTIHIGMDEVWGLGMGHYLEEHGFTDRRVLLLSHLQRVVEMAKKYGYFCEIWSDMFYRLVQGSDFNDDGVIPDDIRDSIPEGVRIVHWSYQRQTEEVLRKQIAQNKALCDTMTFAGGAWKWHGLAPDNKYSIDVTERQLRICTEQGVSRYMTTLWSDAGAHSSIYSVLPTLFATAEMACGKTREEIDKNRFKQITGVEFDDFMLLDYLNNPFFKDIQTVNSRCHWGLLSDLFLGSYDLLLDEHSNEAYAALAERYEAVQAGEYQLVFDDFRFYAKVLSIKMNLGVQIRRAYREGNKALLEQYAKVEIPRMITYMQEFMQNFKIRWLSENMAFGLEVHHLFYGGQIERWKYVSERLIEYLADGHPIDEMEREELMPSIIPQTDEDRCREMNYRKLISYCGI